MSKLKCFIAISSLVFVLLPSVNFTLAVAGPAEATYPVLPGAPTITRTTLINQYIQYAFIFAFMAAGISGVIAIIISGFQILLYAGSPSKTGDARARIFNAILGIVLLMTSFILLRTINPSFIVPSIIPLSTQPGLYIRVPVTVDEQHPDGFEYYLAPTSVTDATTYLSAISGYLSGAELYYDCEDDRTILLWAYNQTDFFIDEASNGGPSVTTYAWPCGGFPYNGNVITPIIMLDGSILSFYWTWETAGVYYYMKNDCEGISSFFNKDSPSQQASYQDIPWFSPVQGEEIDQSVRSMRIFNDEDQGFNYVVILNQAPNFSAECSGTITNPNPGSLCINIGDPAYPQTLTLDGDLFNPWSAYVTEQTHNPDDERNQGITFWAPHLYLTLDQISLDPNLTIGSEYVYDGNFDDLLQNAGTNWYEGVEDVSAEECCAVELDADNNLVSLNPDCIDDDGAILIDPTYVEKDYNSCIDYLTVEGDYDIIIYTKNDVTNDRVCAVINDGVIFNTRLYSNTGSVAPPYYLDHSKIIYKTVVIPTY